ADAGEETFVSGTSRGRRAVPDGVPGARVRDVLSDTGYWPGGRRTRERTGGRPRPGRTVRGSDAMNKRQFVAGRRDAWRRFEAILDKIEGKGLRRLTAEQTAEFSRLFREVSYDLSLVRSREWGRGLVSFLNDLTSRGHNAFYSAPPGNLRHLWRF